VIPESFGTFGATGSNLVLPAGLVCDGCNSGVFSPLETRFKEDTDMGLFCQMYDVAGQYEVRLKNANCRPQLPGFFGEDGIKPFPHIILPGHQVVFRPQIIIPGEAGAVRILLMDKIDPLPRTSRKFRKIKESLGGRQYSGIQIFGFTNQDGGNDVRERGIALLNGLGVTYYERVSNYQANTYRADSRYELQYSVSLGRDAARILAKVAFNYVAFCASNSGLVDVLRGSEFNVVKDYILGRIDPPIRTVIEDVSQHTTLFDDMTSGTRLLVHRITFGAESGRLVAWINFFGLMENKIILGDLPAQFARPNFGCGHAFDPFNKEFYQLTQNRSLVGAGAVGPGFGLFNRI